MAGPSNALSLAESHGKEIVAEPIGTSLLTLKATDLHKSIYVKVYRKWTVTNKASIPVMHCCILLDKEGGAMQANVRPREKDRFNILEVDKTYIIKGFGFQDATAMLQAVPHPLLLAFRKYTDINAAPDTGFPTHYFNFVPYNELYSKVDMKQGLLTDYVGYVQYVTELLESVKPTKEVVHWRDIAIQNLDGRTVRFTLWNEKARNFKMQEYEKSEKPTVIAVTSCIVKTYGGLQLSNTAATTYYFNPDIQEANEIRSVYNEFFEAPTISNVQYQRCSDIEMEKKRNRVMLQDLINENPEHYQNVRFTVLATIQSISNTMPWYYARCLVCNSKVSERFPHAHCNPTNSDEFLDYSYCFKAYIYDNTGKIMVTCFSNEAHSIVRPCNEMTKKLEQKDPYTLPSELVALQGKTYIFQLHYGKDSTKEQRFFFLDKAWDTTPLLAEKPDTDFATPSKTEIHETSGIKPEKLTSEASLTPLAIEVPGTDVATPPTKTEIDTTADVKPTTPATEIQKDAALPETSFTKDEKKKGSARKALFQTTKDTAAAPATKKTKKND